MAIARCPRKILPWAWSFFPIAMGLGKVGPWGQNPMGAERFPGLPGPGPVTTDGFEGDRPPGTKKSTQTDSQNPAP